MIIGIVLAGLGCAWIGIGWHMTSEDPDDKYDSSNAKPQGLERVKEAFVLPGLFIVALILVLVITVMIAVEFWPEEEGFMGIG